MSGNVYPDAINENERRSSVTMQDYIERSVPAKTVTVGEHVATFNGRRTQPVFRRVTRVSNGTTEIGLTFAGAIVPQWIGNEVPVLVRVPRQHTRRRLR